MYYTKIRGNKYHEGWNMLSPSDIILTVDDKKLTGMLIPGVMSHAALCVAKRPSGYEVVEMTHTDYTQSDFFDICKESSRVLIIQCLDWDLDYQRMVIEAARSLKNAKYDVEFELGVQSLYCSELVYQSDKIAYFNRYEKEGTLLQVDLSDLAGLGRPYLSPDGLLFAKNIRCKWDSDGQLAGKIGPQIELELCP